MNYILSLRKEAKSDLKETFQWYESESYGLGEKFIIAFETSAGFIIQNPLMYPIVYKDIRRTLIRNFPYAIFYRIRETKVIVIACLHTSRDPEIWQSRVVKN
ncbi:MAG: type II toxin-antitoxin system RelE/ParE family toxin [Ignavibacteriales bacterium]|nr:type II toxin-antitoxin system RelE/ParE family toxin [Ignavibacteriales bacterium]